MIILILITIKNFYDLNTKIKFLFRRTLLVSDIITNVITAFFANFYINFIWCYIIIWVFEFVLILSDYQT